MFKKGNTLGKQFKKGHKTNVGRKHPKETIEKMKRVLNSGSFKKGYYRGKKTEGLSVKMRNLKYKEEKAGRKRPERCEVCGALGRLDFDHNHKNGEFRGWLCRRCNLILGQVKDNSELLISLAEYLKKN